MVEVKENENTENVERTTLLEWGARLPIGPNPGAGTSSDIQTKRWTMKQEKILGERRKASADSGDNMAKYVSSVLAVMCESLGGKTFESDKLLSNELLVGQMWMPDVFYAYVWTRVQALGPELKMDLQSPYTKESFKWVGDLNTMIVKVLKDPKGMFWDYELKEPLQIRRKTVTKLKMGPQVWNMVEQINPAKSNEACAKEAAIRGSIHEIPELQEGPIALIEGDLDDMGKRDIEKLAESIDLNGLGPIMVLEVEDPTIKTPEGVEPKTFVTQIDWRYDNFFGTSSR